MCGRFALYHSRDEYLAALQLPDGVLISAPQGAPRYNIAPGTDITTIQPREHGVELRDAHWGYAPKWWRDLGKPPLINARIETAATSRMFSSLWKHNRVIVPASCWYEWKKSPENPRIKQPYAIFEHDKNPLFFAALKPAGKDGEEGGVVILTAASHGGLKPIHDRRPLALPPDIARQWLDTSQQPPSGDLLADVYSLPSDAFECYPVAPAIGFVRNDSPELLTPIAHPRI